MRKQIIRPVAIEPQAHPQEKWLDLDRIASLEVTSEDPDFPIESALTAQGPGWRAAVPGEQIVRVVFDNPRPLHRIMLEFSESAIQRTQEFTLAWSRANGSSNEIIRQQWNFSPQGSTSEIEDYQVQLEDVAALELKLKPDTNSGYALASLTTLRLA